MREAVRQTQAPPEFLGKALESTAGRASRWSALLTSVEAPIEDRIVVTDETTPASLVAVTERCRVLMSVYEGDYHTDAIELDRLAAKVAAGRERIFFWGDLAAIGKLREDIGRAKRETGIDPDLLALGTASLLDASEIFGEGVWELSRTGSTSASVAALEPNLAILQALLCSDQAADRPPLHTLFATPRNRVSGPSLRGGAAIHRMHVRDLRSAFLGLAPWYVMQQGFLEILDYRELHRDPTQVGVLVRQAPGPWFADETDADYAASLIRLSFELDPNTPDDINPCETGFAIHEPSDLAGAGHQPLFISAVGQHSIQSLLDAASRFDPACIVARVPLIRGNDRTQRALADAGFMFCAMEPPRPGTTPPRWIGHWCRPRSDTQIAPPYYLDYPARTRTSDVLMHLRRLVRILGHGDAAGVATESRTGR
jgi:hypothetical protein